MIEVGQTLPVWRVESVSAAKMKALAVILRDPNPIHLDPALVKRLGLGDRVINQGPANLGYVLNMLHRALPDARLVQVDSRFLGNVFDGDTVEASGRVTSLEATKDGWLMECAIWLDVVGRGRVVSGVAAMVMPAQPSCEPA